jgi:hypothetical protein
LTIADQVRRLVELGVPEAAGVAKADFVSSAADLPDLPDAVVAVHPRLVPAAALTPLLNRNGRAGFVVSDLVDLEEFVPVDGLAVPDRPLYVLREVERGDDLLGKTPAEALPLIVDRTRSPLTISEGLSWLLQQPEQLQPNACFMTIGSRKRRRGGFDARTPAIWISGGTGRDGKDRRGAPKVGWCWAGNRHSWLGFASASGRLPS